MLANTSANTIKPQRRTKDLDFEACRWSVENGTPRLLPLSLVACLGFTPQRYDGGLWLTRLAALDPTESGKEIILVTERGSPTIAEGVPNLYSIASTDDELDHVE
jgi:hypothetical protein